MKKLLIFILILGMSGTAIPGNNVTLTIKNNDDRKETLIVAARPTASAACDAYNKSRPKCKAPTWSENGLQYTCKEERECKPTLYWEENLPGSDYVPVNEPTTLLTKDGEQSVITLKFGQEVTLTRVPYKIFYRYETEDKYNFTTFINFEKEAEKAFQNGKNLALNIRTPECRWWGGDCDSTYAIGMVD